MHNLWIWPSRGLDAPAIVMIIPALIVYVTVIVSNSVKGAPMLRFAAIISSKNATAVTTNSVG